MAQIDWHQKGHDYAYNWEMEKFPNRTAACNYVDGYEDEAGDWDD